MIGVQTGVKGHTRTGYIGSTFVRWFSGDINRLNCMLTKPHGILAFLYPGGQRGKRECLTYSSTRMCIEPTQADTEFRNVHCI